MSVVQQLEEICQQGQQAFAGASSLAELDSARVAVLGRKGSLTHILSNIKHLDPSDRPVVGKRGNEIRQELERLHAARLDELEAQALLSQLEAGTLDITLPGRAQTFGAAHLNTQIIDEITQVFTSLGYRVYEGPEVETDYYNFTALNTPADHPGRSLADTYYVHDRSGAQTGVKGETNVVLRTQTSGVQIHVMEEKNPPIYMIAPGKVYRRDTIDPTHLPQFTQVEGLVVDKGITFGDLKGTLEHLVEQLFGKGTQARFRPHFFPFTEPSCEVDMSCPFCNAQGCRVCKGEGWIEILGAGMVDPNVFECVGIDPEVYSGFAFGIGVERIAALRYNIAHLRMLVDGDMRFLRQF